MSLRLKDTAAINITKNSGTTTKLATPRAINGTNFDGSAAITTANWGTGRNIGIVNSDGTGTAVTTSVNGSANVNLKLPSTIKASLTGNASTATKLANPRTITLSGSITGSASFDGSANITISTSTNHSHSYLPLSGGTMTGAITRTTNTTSNYIYFLRGFLGTTSSATYDAQIGWHNTGDTSGALILLPYATSTDPWNASVGLYISKTRLRKDGVDVLTANGGTLTSSAQLQRAGKSVSWVTGRSACIVKTNSSGSSQYCPIWSCKSQNGSWDCGTYTSDRLHFSYITDANFNSNNNTQTANIYFETNGGINCKAITCNGTTFASLITRIASLESQLSGVSAALTSLEAAVK